jgi:EmrB/QacA subfamily drug resistance transporter
VLITRSPGLTRQGSESPTAKAGPPREALVLTVVVLAQFMVVVDFTIVQIALPSIGKEFGVSITGLQWIVTAYGLTLAGFLLLSGRAGDRYGHKKLFIIGVLFFSVASLSAGLAPTESVLILARAVQGFAAAMASSTGLSILTATFSEGKQRNRALSVFAAVTGLGSAAGMIAGGVITATLGWRWVFDINVPIGLAIAILSFKYIMCNKMPSLENSHLDIAGAVSVTTGLMLLVYSLSVAQNIGIESAEALELLISSVIVLAVFLLIEYRSKAPLMPIEFLRRGSIFAANTLALIQLAGYVGMVFILTIYFQQVLGYSAFSAGLAFIPMAVVFLIVSGFISARLVSWFGVKPTIISGMVLQTVGYLLLSRISTSGNYFGGLLVPMLIVALGTGFSFTAINIAGLTGTKKGEEGLASGLINTSRQIGGPVGLAVFLTVANITPLQLSSSFEQSQQLMVAGFGHSFLAAAFLTAIGILFASLLGSQAPRHAGVTAATIH